MAQYIKNDTENGYIEDGLEIEYLKFNNLRHSVLGFMLGEFDENGNYVISKKIKQELLGIKKYIADTTDNIEICLSAIKLDKQITFMVTYEGERVTLSLIEKLSYEANYKLNSGTYSNINEYVLDVVETSGVVDRNLIYKRWNIDPYGGQVLDVFNMDEETLLIYAGLVGRFKYLLNANKILLDKEEKLEEIEAEYAESMLKTISHYPELKKAFDKELKETLNNKKDFLKKEKPNYYKTLNEIIDNIVESNKNLLDEKSLEQFEAEKKSVLQTVNVKREGAVDLQTSQYDTKQINDKHLAYQTLDQSATGFVLASKQVEAEHLKNDTNDYSYIDTYLKDIGVEFPITKIETPQVTSSNGLGKNNKNQQTTAPQQQGNENGRNGSIKGGGGGSSSTSGKKKKEESTKKEKGDAVRDADNSYSRGGGGFSSNIQGGNLVGQASARGVIEGENTSKTDNKLNVDDLSVEAYEKMSESIKERDLGTGDRSFGKGDVVHPEDLNPEEGKLGL